MMSHVAPTNQPRLKLTTLRLFDAAVRLGLVLLLGWLPQGDVCAQQVRLELNPVWLGRPLVLAQSIKDAKSAGFSLTRLDGLLSELALQRTNGTWLESGAWHVFFSVEQQRLTAMADGLPPEPFQAIRFRIGVDAKTDASDPQVWPPGHPLHPDVCGLHWGWSSGYVFLAVEGHWESAPGQRSGFSYHLAGAENPMMVELPIQFSGAQSSTIQLRFDVDRLLDAGAVVREATSTHSRSGDALASRLKATATRSFAVESVRTDLYQPTAVVQPVAKTAPPGATPYHLAISERLPKVKLPEDNFLTEEGVELGRRLFSEPRLSRDNSQSCASCHEPARAFTDGRPQSIGASGDRGRRNAMPLVNLAWAREFFWDGRARTLREQVLMPIQDAHEMNETLERVVTKLAADANYPAQFKAAFGSSEITTNGLALALEQFLLTLVSQESRFDHAARKLVKLTSQEQRGLQLFVTEHDPARGLRGADCFHCHGGNLFSNHQSMNNGLEERAGDLGRMEITKSEVDRGKFKVPSLRNVALTAPYMHDGRFATLAEVVAHYNGPLHRSATLDPNLAKHPEAGLNLSVGDQAALVAFLKTLTDEQFLRPPPAEPLLSTTR
jgi:cytochrome c peroxidase